MELCDVVDQFGNRMGRIVTRGTELASGEFYLVVHVWIKDENNHYLIQQRALHLEAAPGLWTPTTGYVMAGEESMDGAIREVKEELGIQLLPGSLKRLARYMLENRVEDIWLADIPRDSMEVSIQNTEVADHKWVSESELRQMADRGEFFRYSYFDNIFGAIRNL